MPIQLYEYDIRAKSMVLRSDGLMGRLEVMPGLILPVFGARTSASFRGQAR